MLLLGLLLPLASLSGGLTLLRTGAYMLCPYLLTTASGLWAFRKIRGNESLYLCCGMAGIISMGSLLMQQIFPLLYTEQYFLWWLAALLFLGLATAKQYHEIIRRSEELTWN